MRNTNAHNDDKDVNNSDNPVDYPDTIAATVRLRNQRKMSHMHNILRERREASLALDNLLRPPPPANVDGKHNEQLSCGSACATIIHTQTLYAPLNAYSILLGVLWFAYIQTLTNRTWSFSIRKSVVSWKRRTRNTRSCTVQKVPPPVVTIGYG